MAPRNHWLAWIGLFALLAAGCRIDPGAFDDVGEDSNGRLHYRWSGGDFELEVLAKGELGFNDDYSDLKSLSEGGIFSIEESADGSTRKYEVTPKPDSTLVRSFWIDGNQRNPDDPALREWLDQVFPHVLRETGFKAAERVRWLREQGGVGAVLDEISKIESGTSRAIYLEELVENGPLEEEELSQVLQEAQKIPSNGDLSRLLQTLSTQHRGSRSVTLKLIEACGQLQSSGERRRVMERIAEERDLDTEAAVALAKTASGIRSDSERAQAILRAAERSPRDVETAEAFFEAASTIRSSSEKSRVYRELLSKPGLTDAVLAKAAGGIADISSPSEKGLALVKYAEVLDPDWKNSLAAFFDATATIGSVGEKEHVISSFVARGDLKPATLERTLTFTKAELPEGPLRQRLVDKIQRRLTGS